LVPGAGRGIGAATAAALAAAGARVVLAARDGEALEAVAQAIRDEGSDALAVPADVARPGDVDALFAAIAERGPLSALVCAAAVLTPAPVEQTTDEGWDRTLAVNLTGSFLCCRAAFQAMRAPGEGPTVKIA